MLIQLFLSIVVLVPLYSKLLGILDKAIVQKIENADNSSESLAFRKRLLWLRRISPILFAIVLFCFFYLLLFLLRNISGWYTLVFNLFLSSVFSTPIFLIYVYFHKINGNVSTHDKEIFIKKHLHFALFLRGFRSDNYTQYDDLDLSGLGGTFSEYRLAECVNPIIPLCAVGMTKESDAPFGATRIYLNDSNWKEDVLDLINKATFIFILVDDRPSCIWEIVQSKNFLEKAVLMVDSLNKYNKVRRELLFPAYLPEIKENVDSFVIYYPHKQPKIQLYDSFSNAYNDIVDIIGIRKAFWKTKEDQAYNVQKIILYALLFLVACYVIYMIMNL